MVLSEGNGASDALGDSWQMTAEHFWPLLALALLGLIPSLGTLVEAFASAGLIAVPFEGLGYEIVHQVANAVSALYGIYSISLSVAAYWLLRGDRRTIEEVFA